MAAAETSAGLTFQSLNFPVAEVSLSDFDENATLLVLDENLDFLTGIPGASKGNIGGILEQADRVVAAALSGEDDPDKFFQINPNQTLTVAVPVMGKDGNELGIVVLRTLYPPRGILIGVLSYIGGSLIFFTIAAGLGGTIFGFITARGLTRRLHRITLAANGWSRGDFSSYIQDLSGDEIGQLTQRLNRMAEQLQNLLHTRQELAAMDERNRLARDLHDSVKQQVFAIVMQLGAARSLIQKDPKAADARLLEAENLTRKAQAEFPAIIRQLGPGTLEIKGLSLALKEQIAEWSHLNNINTKAEIPEPLSFSLEVEQALYRITQEALANIARHSQAKQVDVVVDRGQDEVSITISDNGVGFDTATAEGKGVGLSNMRDRIEGLNGSLVVESILGQGTRIVARCPIKKE